jgi:hypothetical protein
MISTSNAESVALGILGNVLTVLVLFALGYVMFYASRRAKLVKFFHLRKNRAITLYTSSLNVLSGGSHGVDGVPRSYQGPAIPTMESLVIADFQRTFASVAPSKLEASGYLSHLRFTDISCAAEPSPSSLAQVVRDRTLLTIGSPAYNVASLFVEREFAPIGKFGSDFLDLDLPAGYPPSDVLCGFVVRAHHPTTKQVAFYAAGPSAPGTVAAARYLLEHWQDLAKSHEPDQPFCVLVKALNVDGTSYVVLK